MSKQMPMHMEDAMLSKIGQCVLDGALETARYIAAEFALYRDTWPTRAEWEAAVLG